MLRAGWESYPTNWLQYLAIHYAGASSNLPMNSRLSIGPSLFTWFPYFLDSKENNAKDIVTIPIIDYSLAKPLHNDNYNKTGTNSLWTELSSAVYGFLLTIHII